MAKKSLLGTLTTLSAVVAATAAVYYKREEIRNLLQTVRENFIDAPAPAAEPEGWEDGEGDLVIQMSAEQMMPEKEVERGEE